MSRPTPPTYKTRNWPAYNEALKRRGSLTIWLDPTMTWQAAPTGKRGRQRDYGDAAIQTNRGIARIQALNLACCLKRTGGNPVLRPCETGLEHLRHSEPLSDRI